MIELKLECERVRSEKKNRWLYLKVIYFGRKINDNTLPFVYTILIDLSYSYKDRVTSNKR